MNVDKVTDFILSHTVYTNRDVVKEAVIKHLLYDTCAIVENKGEIIAVARWNITGDTAEVLDVVVHPKHRNKQMLKYLIWLGWQKCPYVKTMTFKRGVKYPDRKDRVYQIGRMLKGEKNG